MKTNSYEKENTKRIKWMWIGLSIISLLTFWTIIIPIIAVIFGIEKTKLV